MIARGPALDLTLSGSRRGSGRELWCRDPDVFRVDPRVVDLTLPRTQAVLDWHASHGLAGGWSG